MIHSFSTAVIWASGKMDDSPDVGTNGPHSALQTRQGRKWRCTVGRDELQLRNSTLIPLLTLFRPASLFSFSLFEKRERIKGEKGCVVQNGLEHFQRKYEILQLQKAI